MLSYAIDFITELGRFDRLDIRISGVMGDSFVDDVGTRTATLVGQHSTQT